MELHNYLLVLCSILVVSCGGGGDGGGTGNGNPGNSITVTACTFSGDDSFADPQVAIDTAGDRETNFVRSHTQGFPTYHVEVTRQNLTGTDITTDYMVHTPVGTPKAIVVLIAGGTLNAGITGIVDGDPPTNSRGNFLVRSAHRFLNAGYKVITIDRPSDYVTYNLTSNFRYDPYRNSMDHAVDLAKIINRENTGNLPIFLAGTSRGAVSAAANNTLANGIAISSPVTRDVPSSTEDSAVGTTNLPLSRIQRSVHILLHTDDTCTSSSAASSRDLFNNMDSLGIDVTGDEVDGGFADSFRSDVCGAFDFHGFNGIENCAVRTATDWLDDQVTNLTSGSNSTPTASNGMFMESDTIDLSTLSSEPDATDTLAYSLPYAFSALGGSVSVNPTTGIMSYSAPAVAAGVIDTVAYVVNDGQGGIDTAVIHLVKE